MKPVKEFRAVYFPRIVAALAIWSAIFLVVYVIAKLWFYNVTTLKIDLVIPDKFIGVVEVDWSDSPKPQPNGVYLVPVKNGRAVFPAKYKDPHSFGDFDVKSIRTESGELLQPRPNNAGAQIDVTNIGGSTSRPFSKTPGDTIRIGRRR